MKRLIILTVMAVATTLSPAVAADLITGAAVPCTVESCSGFYVGAGLSGNGSNADVIGGGLSQSVFAGGAVLDGHVGYQVWNGSYLFAVEAGFGNQFTNGPLSGIGANNLIGYEGIKLGGALAGLIRPPGTSTVPGQAPGSLPVLSSIASQMITPYVWLGAIQRGGYNQGTFGAGVEYVLARNWNVDARYVYAPALDKLEAMQMLTLGVNYHF